MKRQRFYQALSELVDDEITPELFNELENHLLASDKACEDYREFMLLHSLVALEVGNPRLKNEIVPIDRIVRLQKTRQARMALISAAALLALLVGLLSIIFVRAPRNTASLRSTPGSIYTLTRMGGAEDELSHDTLVQGSRVVLSQGFVELKLPNETLAIIQAPADFTLHDQNLVYFDHGHAWFHVPPAAVGFRVKTPDMLVTDLGTRFGILSTHEALDQVHVFEGRVQVLNYSGLSKEIFLPEGQAVTLSPRGTFDETDLSPDRFATELPQALPHVHWSFDEVVDNRYPAGGSIPAGEEDFSARPIDDDLSLQSGGTGRFGGAFTIDTARGQGLRTGFPGISGTSPRSVAFWLRSDRTPAGAAALVVWGRRDYPVGHALDSRREIERWKINLVSHSGRNRDDEVGKLQIIGTGHLIGETYLCDGRWHHVVCTYKADPTEQPEVRVFIDGREERLSTEFPQKLPGTVPVTQDAAAVPLSIGYRLGGYIPRSAIKVEMDELYVFKGALNREAALQLMHHNSPAISPIPENQNQ